MGRRYPRWLDTAVFYEIYPQSFYDTNGDGIGDIPGIAQKLDYIRELGCNALWLNPCFASPFGDAGYDVSDYYSVAPRYGTNEDLKTLFREAHGRGMRVLLDLVPGHTSWEHPWFRESLKPEANPYTDRYVWTDSVWEEPQGMGSLRGLSDRDGSCAVNFFSSQPALNYGFARCEKSWQQPVDAPGPRATLRAMKDVMRFWLDMGCDGFRVDMAFSLVKNDEGHRAVMALWREVRAELDEYYPQAVLVSEWGNPREAIAGGFHMDFLLHFGASHYNDLFRCQAPWFSARGGGSLDAFIRYYRDSLEATKDQGFICIPSGNHDMERLARTLSPEEMKLAFAFLLSMPGVPFLYYGDEIGMRYLEGLVSVEGGYHRTGSRSPMQWDGTPNAGFSAANPDKLYIPIDPDPMRPTVAAQQGEATSLWRTVQALIRLRKANGALQSRGEIEFLQTDCPLVYRRSGAGQRILVLINPGQEPYSAAGFRGKLLYAIGGKVDMEGDRCHVDGGTAAFVLED